jgi:nucleotide-binding universal stress UspA family protein
MPAAIAGRGASAAYLEAARESAREKARALENEFEGLCEQAGVHYSWVTEDGDHLERLAYHAHAADVTIVSKPGQYENLEDHFRLSTMEEFTLVSGCPVLVLPHAEKIPTFGSNIMVAWKSTREALRAVRDGLGFLKDAEKVTVLSIGPTASDALSETEFVNYLRRHEITAEPHNVDEGEGIGETLLASAASHGCDMIIMGAYGHSHLREVLLGGATRYVFRNLEIPVLMAH